MQDSNKVEGLANQTLEQCLSNLRQAIIDVASHEKTSKGVKQFLTELVEQIVDRAGVESSQWDNHAPGIDPQAQGAGTSRPAWLTNEEVMSDPGTNQTYQIKLDQTSGEPVVVDRANGKIVCLNCGTIIG